MFDWPTSSPQMITMLGFFSAWAAPVFVVIRPVVARVSSAPRFARFEQSAVAAGVLVWQEGAQMARSAGAASTVFPRVIRPAAATYPRPTPSPRTSRVRRILLFTILWLLVSEPCLAWSQTEKTT